MISDRVIIRYERRNPSKVPALLAVRRSVMHSFIVPIEQDGKTITL